MKNNKVLLFFFRRAGLFQQILHSLRNIHQPYLFTDWDTEDGDLAHFRNKWREVRKEMMGLIFLNMVENLLMMIPLIYTGLCFIIIIISHCDLSTHNYTDKIGLQGSR